MTYQENRKLYLSDYKRTFLAKDSGIWRDKIYDHILPLEKLKLNIIGNIRDDFWEYYKTTNIKLHQNFHHLNSSQALCFNLFFPMFNFDKRILTYVLHRIIEVKPVFSAPQDELEKLFSIKNQLLAESYANELDMKFIEKNKIIDCQFEKILDSLEGTNFDFYVSLQNNHRVLFEIKFTESEFGKAKKNVGHFKKYDELYKDRLSRIIKPEFNNLDFVMENYQIIRNLSYINDLTTIVFLYPEKNNSISNTLDIIYDTLLDEKKSQVRIIYLVNFVRLLLEKGYLDRLKTIYEEFKLKYCD